MSLARPSLTVVTVVKSAAAARHGAAAHPLASTAPAATLASTPSRSRARDDPTYQPVRAAQAAFPSSAHAARAGKTRHRRRCVASPVGDAIRGGCENWQS
jgi:hypothetical protein